MLRWNNNIYVHNSFARINYILNVVGILNFWFKNVWCVLIFQSGDNVLNYQLPELLNSLDLRIPTTSYIVGNWLFGYLTTNYLPNCMTLIYDKLIWYVIIKFPFGVATKQHNHTYVTFQNKFKSSVIRTYAVQKERKDRDNIRVFCLYWNQWIPAKIQTDAGF
jgi:hypothetical protein